MPYSKEQLKAYYQANKEKLNQQRSERRKLAGLRQVETIKANPWVETPEKVETGLRQSEVETAREMSQPEKVETTQLWSDYYTAKKPYCHSCAKQGIKEAEYQFCSEAQIAPNNYQCLVKHWTIYQGQTRLNLSLAFHSKSTPLSLALHETYKARGFHVSVNRSLSNPLLKTPTERRNN